MARIPSIETFVNEATPLMVGGVLYVSTSLSQVAAIDAATGQTLWTHDPEVWKLGTPPNLGWLHRGVAHWTDGRDERIFIGTGNAFLIALDARTGSRLPGSATGGGSISPWDWAARSTVPGTRSPHRPWSCATWSSSGAIDSTGR